MAKKLVDEESLNAPVASAAFNSICRAIREGIIDGEREVDEILDNRVSVFPDANRSSRTQVPKLSEVVSEHASRLKKGRSIAELDGAYKGFVALHGDMRLDELERRHFLEYCRGEAARDVGGKDPNSVKRPLSAQTIRKKVRLLSASINRAMKIGWYRGGSVCLHSDWQ